MKKEIQYSGLEQQTGYITPAIVVVDIEAEQLMAGTYTVGADQPNDDDENSQDDI